MKTTLFIFSASPIINYFTVILLETLGMLPVKHSLNSRFPGKTTKEIIFLSLQKAWCCGGHKEILIAPNLTDLRSAVFRCEEVEVVLLKILLERYRVDPKFSSCDMFFGCIQLSLTSFILASIIVISSDEQMDFFIINLTIYHWRMMNVFRKKVSLLVLAFLIAQEIIFRCENTV